MNTKKATKLIKAAVTAQEAFIKNDKVLGKRRTKNRAKIDKMSVKYNALVQIEHDISQQSATDRAVMYDAIAAAFPALIWLIDHDA